MLVLDTPARWPLNLLALGAGGHVAAACHGPGMPADLTVWDVRAGTAVVVPTEPSGFGGDRPLAFTPDGRWLLTGGPGRVGFADPTTGRMSGRQLRVPGIGYALSPDGAWVLVADHRVARALARWDVPDGDRLFPLAWGIASDGPFGCPAVSPTGVRVAAVTASASDRAALSIQVRDAGTGAALLSIPFDPADPVQQLAFTADGGRLLVRYRDRTVAVYDADTGQPAGELVHPRRPYLTGLAVGPSGMIATSRNDGTVTFWDPDTLQVITRYDWQLGRLASVAFSPDGTLAAAGTEDGRVVVWDVDL